MTLTPHQDNAPHSTYHTLVRTSTEPGMAVHTCDHDIRKLRQEDHKFDASLGYKVRLSLKKEKKNANHG